MIFIQAETYEKAKACADMYALENEHHEWEYVFTVEQLLGRDPNTTVIWRYNGWYDHPMAMEIYEQTLIRRFPIYDKVEKWSEDYNKHKEKHASRIMPKWNTT